jgi:hypothetical protein
MRRVVANAYDVGVFVSRMARCHFDERVDRTLGVVDDSFEPSNPAWVRGGVIYTNYSDAAIWMHVAGRGEAWITKEMLWKAFHYPFVQLGCVRIYGLVEAANDPALRFDLRLGFSVVASLPEMFASGPGLVVSMRRDECRWLRLAPAEMMEA